MRKRETINELYPEEFYSSVKLPLPLSEYFFMESYHSFMSNYKVMMNNTWDTCLAGF